MKTNLFALFTVVVLVLTAACSAAPAPAPTALPTTPAPAATQTPYVITATPVPPTVAPSSTPVPPTSTPNLPATIDALKAQLAASSTPTATVAATGTPTKTVSNDQTQVYGYGKLDKMEAWPNGQVYSTHQNAKAEDVREGSCVDLKDGKGSVRWWGGNTVSLNGWNGARTEIKIGGSAAFDVWMNNGVGYYQIRDSAKVRNVKWQSGGDYSFEYVSLEKGSQEMRVVATIYTASGAVDYPNKRQEGGTYKNDKDPTLPCNGD